MKRIYTQKFAKGVAQELGDTEIRARVRHGLKTLTDKRRGFTVCGETWEQAVLRYAGARRRFDDQAAIPVAPKKVSVWQSIVRFWRSLKVALLVGLARLKP